MDSFKPAFLNKGVDVQVFKHWARVKPLTNHLNTSKTGEFLQSSGQLWLNLFRRLNVFRVWQKIYIQLSSSMSSVS